jgi:hypothetical protein
MISDILSQMIDDLDHYLVNPDYDDTYKGELRERIIRLRGEAEYIRAVLDTPPCEPSPPETVLQERSVTDQHEKFQKYLEWMMSDETGKRHPFFSQKDLLKRGWSKALIARLLGDPDWKQENPHYPGTAKMLCWRQDRVLAAEEEAAFQELRR